MHKHGHNQGGIIKILATADTHVSSTVRTGGVAVRGDFDYAIDSLIPLVRQIRPDIALHAGDLASLPRIDGEEIDQIVRFREALGVTTYEIDGNHDGGKMSLSKHLGFENLDNRVITLPDGTRIFGIAAQVTQDLTRERLRTMPACDILVLHAPLSVFFGIEGERSLNVEDIPEGPRMVISGDIHITSVQGRFVSPGNFYPRKKDEFLGTSPGFVVVDTADWSVTPYYLPKRKAVVLTPGEGDEDWMAEYAEACKIPPLLYAEPEDCRRLEEAAKACGVIMIPGRSAAKETGMDTSMVPKPPGAIISPQEAVRRACQMVAEAEADTECGSKTLELSMALVNAPTLEEVERIIKDVG